jgi:hypothetical protein
VGTSSSSGALSMSSFFSSEGKINILDDTNSELAIDDKHCHEPMKQPIQGFGCYTKELILLVDGSKLS